MENYADYPKQLGDARSDRTEKAEDWTVREMLIELLRRVDSGEDFEAMVCCYRSKGGKWPDARTTFVAAGGTPVECWGIVARAAFLLHSSDR